MTVPSCGVWEPQVGPRAPVSRISQDHRVARPARVRRRPIPGLRATPERPPSSAHACASSSTQSPPRSSRPMMRSSSAAKHRTRSLRRSQRSRSCSRPQPSLPSGDHFTIADAALAPFLGRWELSLRNDLGKFCGGHRPACVPGAVPERALCAPAEVPCEYHQPREL